VTHRLSKLSDTTVFGDGAMALPGRIDRVRDDGQNEGGQRRCVCLW
jgi:hypothetical protein